MTTLHAVTTLRRNRTFLAGLLAGGLLLLGMPLTANAGEDDDYQTTVGTSEPIYHVQVTEEYHVPTKWGTIYGVVERPVVPPGVTVPVILTYSPYNVLIRPVGALPQESLGDLVASYFVPRGYARATFDLVGTRESGGCYDHGGVRERETGAAVVEFLAAQKWSSGKVGMIGASYDGTTQWGTAVEAPKHLVTIVPQVGIGRWYDYAYGQGVRFYSGTGTPVDFDFGFGFAPPTGVAGGTAWAEALQGHLNPCERVLHNEKAFLPNPVYDAYWDERDYVTRISKIKASVLLVGSWTDYNVHPVNSYEMWRALPAGLPKKLIMGQKAHTDLQVSDNQELYHAWFDHWLLGLDTGIMKLPATDSVTNGNIRFQGPSWPPVGTATVSMTLGTAGSAQRGRLALVSGAVARWTDGSPVLQESTVLGGSAGDSAVLFTGAPVSKEVRISGVPVLDAQITTSATSTYLTPVLYDQAPGGARVMVCRGLLNSHNRVSERVSTSLVAGETWRAQVRFQPADYLLAAGHSLGVALMSMDTDEALYPDASRATNTVVLDGRSQLLVPVSQNAGSLGTVLVKHAKLLPPALTAHHRSVQPAELAATGLGSSLPAAGAGLLALVLVRRRRQSATGGTS